jgi:hypothetical protein
MEFTSITAKIISRKCTYKELQRKSAFLVRKKIEALLLYCFVSCNFFFQISHENKVYWNIKMNLTSTVNIRFTVSVAVGLYCLCTNGELLAKCLTSLLQFFCDRQIFDFFCFCGISHSAFINSTISVETQKMFYRNLVWKHWSEQWQHTFESNALYSYW